MAATATALLGQFEAVLVGGLSVPNAFNGSQSGQATNLDLFQIANAGDYTYGTLSGLTVPPTILLNVDYKGAVHNIPVKPTNGTRLGIFFTRLPNGSATAAIFADAFENLSKLDIVQTIVEGGSIAYWLDYLGVAHGA